MASSINCWSEYLELRTVSILLPFFTLCHSWINPLPSWSPALKWYFRFIRSVFLSIFWTIKDFGPNFTKTEMSPYVTTMRTPPNILEKGMTREYLWRRRFFDDNFSVLDGHYLINDKDDLCLPLPQLGRRFYGSFGWLWFRKIFWRWAEGNGSGCHILVRFCSHLVLISITAFYLKTLGYVLLLLSVLFWWSHRSLKDMRRKPQKVLICQVSKRYG